jgi:hypothetical protein
MEFGLLIDVEVFEFLQKLPPTRRSSFLRHFRRIQDFPGRYSDYLETDSVGRRIDVSVFAGMAIHYWTDAADRHIKILKIQAAD